MAEAQTELDAENALLAFVMEDEPKAPDSSDLDMPDQVDLDIEDDGRPETQQAKATEQSKAAEQPAEAAQEDYVEIPAAEEGGEPIKHALKDVVAGFQAYQEFESQRAEILDRVESEARESFRADFAEAEAYSKQTAQLIQAALQVVQAPVEPDANMLNPNSQNYNPDAYHLAFANYRNAVALHQRGQQIAQDLMKQAADAAEKASNEQWQREASRIQRAWPEFAKEEFRNKFVSDMGKTFGYKPEEVSAALRSDHRNLLVARDALAYRAMKAQGKDVKAQVETKAPKMVRSKTEAKSGGAQARDQKGQFTNNALTALRKTNSDDAAAAFFAGLSRAGRI